MTVREYYLDKQAFKDALPNVSIREYFELWDKFDYYTFMSDDYSVERKGNQERQLLIDKAKDDLVLLEIGNLFCAYEKSLGTKHKPSINDYLPVLNPDRVKPNEVDWYGVYISHINNSLFSSCGKVERWRSRVIIVH